MDQSLEAKFKRRRIQLVACLIPILAAWYYLVIDVPILFFQGTSGYFASPKKRTVTIFGNSITADWEQYLVFDARTGRIRVEKNATIARNGVSWLEFVSIFQKDGGNAFKRWRLWSGEPSDAPAKNYIEFDFPVRGTPRMVGRRYAVYANASSILVRDVRTADATTVDYPIARQSSDLAVPIGDTNRFVLVHAVVPQPSSASRQEVLVELFEIGETGIPSPISTWRALCGIYHTSSLALTESNEHFISIHPTESHFEIRSTIDGSLIRTQSLPADFDPLADKWHVYRDALNVNNGARSFWITQNRWLKAPDGFLSYYQDSPNHRLRLWIIGDNETQVVTDCDTDKVVSTIATSDLGTFLDDETLLFSFNQWGLAFREVDAKTGLTVRTWRPFWWVFPTLWGSVFAYVIWSIAWLRSATESNRWAWLDIAWVISFPLVALACRLKFVGDTLDIQRDPVFLLQGIFCSLIFLASVWGCNSREWIVRKLLPMVLFFASLGISLSMVFDARIEIATNYFLQAWGFMAISIVVCLVLRVLGFRWAQSSGGPMEEREKASLRDLFVLILLSAALFAPMRLIVPDPTALDLTQISWWPLALLVLAPIMAWAVALHRNRIAHGIGKCLSILLFLYLLFVLPSFHCTGIRMLRFHNEIEGFAITFVTAFVVTFVLSKAFRQRGCKSVARHSVL